MSGRAPDLVTVKTPCPTCGAADEHEAETKCRPSSDETGECWCEGEFDQWGNSVQPTQESLAALDAWYGEQAATVDE